ncbi:uncharacterized protein N0V89_002184 [Didymosphaeria variabile]|uniref:Major facilitator superfamily (MFS) profile domain-containing protein n=1 Tax=Didymosphaeria variabile TaxID=1932322 RepID=A0A9W9CEG0_9PLEO|nr:uncharacterized protein N0V89_002184 [Didymosphaeria variabile]KAJ4357608.1 hypothetical protein N0V89_002184 [Didymosphaeria variabile]
MGLLSRKKAGAEQAVGPELLAVEHALYPQRASYSLWLGAMMNGLQTVKQWRAYFGSPNASILGLLNAIYPVGKVIGLLPCTFLADRFGRKVPLTIGWLVAHGKQGEARRILAKYHAAGDEDSPLVAYELQEIEENIRIETEIQGETSWIDLVRSAPNRKRTLIAVIVGFFAQWNGAGVVSYYLTLVLNSIGITETADQALINGLLQIFNWITAVGAGAMMVDLAGRRPLFLTSVAGMAVSYAIWTALTSTFIKSHDADAGRAVVAVIFIYYFFYNIAWSPLLLAYPVEIFPYSLRGKGVSVSLSCTFIGLIIGQFVNPIAMTAIGWKYYIVFCCILVVLFGVICVLFPETKGRTLEQIAEVFDGKNHKAGMTEVGLKEVDEKMEHVRVEGKI